MSLKIGLVAGEPSGDLIGARVLAGLKRLSPALEAQGIGGPALQAEGMDIWHPMHALTVFGYVDALKRLPTLLRTHQDVKQRWLGEAPDLFLGIDAPDFNLRLEARLKASGTPTVHLVGPSIWAWRYERIHFIKQAVTRILVVFPFEEAIYQNEGIPVTYVGHPLADEIPLVPDLQAARQRLKLDENSRVIAILPGSRASEIKVLAPRFLATAERLFKKDPNLTFLVPMVNESRRQQFDAIAREFNLPSLRVLTQSDLLGQAARPIAWDALEACDVALVASGTATLETALFKKPMVISYYLPLLMRKMMTWKSKQARPYLDWVGLPNILAKDFIVPELLQDEATPEKLTDAVWRLLVDERKQASIAESFLEIHHTLKRDTATIAAQAILNVANGY